MSSFADEMIEFRQLLANGTVQRAYRGLMDYILGLRTHFAKLHPEWDLAGSLYYGFMDMTYFAVFPAGFKERSLKIALVFLYQEFQFDAWLSGSNRKVQEQYWGRIKAINWRKHPLVPEIKGSDSIIEHTIARDPDFGDLESLTRKIEKGTAAFVRDCAELLRVLEG